MLILGCSKDPMPSYSLTEPNVVQFRLKACPDQDENLGLIQKLIYADQDIWTCYKEVPFEVTTKGHVIYTEEDYLAFLDSLTFNPEVCQTEDIDFNQSTLLVTGSGGSGCRRTYKRTVTQDEDEIYKCIITVRECGGCEPWEQRWHWILIDKIPSDSQVKFGAIREQYSRE